MELYRSKAESDHRSVIQNEPRHVYKRDSGIPQWHGWHAARHANVSTTATYYIKTAADDVKQTMEKLENNIPQAPRSFGTPTGHENPPKRNRNPRFSRGRNAN